MEATNKTDRWTKREDKRLTKLVKKFKNKGWILISEYMEGRTGAMCYERWHKYIKPGINRTTWTATEDKILIEAYDRFGDKWVAIAEELPGRTYVACRRRWRHTLQKRVEASRATLKTGDKPMVDEDLPLAVSLNDEPLKATHSRVTIKTGHWTRAEEESLAKLVRKFGTKKWSVIAQHMKSRTADQCWTQWKKSQHRAIRRGEWTAEEDRKIIDAYKRLGEDWVEIAKELPGRTFVAIRKRWKNTLRKRLDTTEKTLSPSAAQVPPTIAHDGAAGAAKGPKTQALPVSHPPVAQAGGKAAVKKSSRPKRALPKAGTSHDRDGAHGRSQNSKRKKTDVSHKESPRVESPALNGSKDKPARPSEKFYLCDLLKLLREEGIQI